MPFAFVRTLTNSPCTTTSSPVARIGTCRGAVLCSRRRGQRHHFASRPRRNETAVGDNPLMEGSGAGPRLIIVCGLPGSGKTTLAKALEGRLRAVRFSPDEWLDALSINLHCEETREKIEALQWKFAQNLLSLGVNVIVEWGAWARSERDTLRCGARALGAAVELHYLSAPVDVLFDRLQRRGRENPPIQRDAVLRWFEILQVPAPEEMALFDEPQIADLDCGSN